MSALAGHLASSSDSDRHGCVLTELTRLGKTSQFTGEQVISDHGMCYKEKKRSNVF